MSQTLSIPLATYRLQFNRYFTFADAAALVPYLHRLGISHCYASPLLKARPGSSHGYDIVDHHSLNPELGSRQDFDRLVETLHAHGMGLIVDIVPNHMGINGSDNAWWLDVLENGPASEYAPFFDIDWKPVHEVLQGKVLLPILGDRYGSVLDRGKIELVYDAPAGSFHCQYYEHRLPLDPKSYPFVLATGIEELKKRLAADHPAVLELENLISACRHLPSRNETGPGRQAERQRDKEIAKQRLAALCKREAAIRRHLDRTVARFNAAAPGAANVPSLHQLLEKQAYRLAYWRVAADEINYRRFFNINSLAGLRMENDKVFETTHSLVLDLVEGGAINGLRIDHPDGLSDPLAYYSMLQDACAARLGLAPTERSERQRPPYVVAEKILASYEHLPETWPLHGTTGYDFANLVNGLFTRPENEAALDAVYHRFIGRRLDFDELVYERKKLIIRVQLSSELTVLANLLKSIAEADRHTRDFTLNGLREALTEVVASFPVYRTYITAEGVSADDRRYLEWAVAHAKRRSMAADTTIFDFLLDTLLISGPAADGEQGRRAMVGFGLKFQQYTAPVMAKAVEDTAFYIYNRLVSLNEVGGEPRRFHVSRTAFHHANQERLRRWPHTMLNTSTHDSKRSEDVRARINLISEIPAEWRARIRRWSRMNRSRKSRVNGRLAPSRNDEYLFYQTLLGTWPLGAAGAAPDDEYVRRIGNYMLKAVKEAKVHTSWINPSEEYEEAMGRFVAQVLAREGKNPFLDDFVPFAEEVGRFGLINGLAQTLLKLTTPGIPDIYQGTELWEWSLVDPDNRRPVDYQQRQALLAGCGPEAAGADRPAEWLASLEDGRLKLFLTSRSLWFRHHHPHLFLEGSYLPLTPVGSRERHLCAFARQWQDETLVVAVPRWLLGLSREEGPPLSPPGARVWKETEIVLPDRDPSPFRNLLTGEVVQPRAEGEHRRLPAAALFATLPVALLHRRSKG